MIDFNLFKRSITFQTLKSVRTVILNNKSKHQVFTSQIDAMSKDLLNAKTADTSPPKLTETDETSLWLVQLYSLFAQGESLELKGYHSCRAYTALFGSQTCQEIL